MARHLTLTRRIQRLEKQRNSRHVLPTVMFAIDDVDDAEISGVGGPHFEIDRQEGESLSDLVARAVASKGVKTVWAVYAPDPVDFAPQPTNLATVSQSGGNIDPFALAGIGVEDARYRGWGAT